MTVGIYNIGVYFDQQFNIATRRLHRITVILAI